MKRLIKSYEYGGTFPAPILVKDFQDKIDNTNLSYIEPHRIIINDITFLAFNYSTEIYIKNLIKKIQITELESYLKSLN